VATDRQTSIHTHAHIDTDTETETGTHVYTHTHTHNAPITDIFCKRRQTNRQTVR